MDVLVRPIAFGSPEHQEEIRLRSAVLREPLGLRFSENELALESTEVRLGAFLDGRLVGCLLLRRVQDEDAFKMRQLAVDPAYQGRGIGKALVFAAETYCQKSGIDEIRLNARLTAEPFYLRLGYESYGLEFQEVGLPHRQMRKFLAME